MLLGHARTVARAARDGAADAPNAELVALQPRDVLDGPGSGSRHRGDATAGGQAARTDPKDRLSVAAGYHEVTKDTKITNNMNVRQTLFVCFVAFVSS